MLVEGRAVDICSVRYLPDGDLIKFFFCQKGSKGIDDSLLRFAFFSPMDFASNLFLLKLL